MRAWLRDENGSILQYRCGRVDFALPFIDSLHGQRL